MSAKPLRIDVWSDIACPWCYVGKRRLEAALAGLAERDSVEVHWRAFELDPRAPRTIEPPVPYADRLARKYSTSREHAEEMIRNMTLTAAAEGLDFHFEKIRPGNTFDAHRVLHFAAERGRGEEARERIFRAYMSEGRMIGDPRVLAELAGEAGLDAAEVLALLATDAYADEVRADESEAAAKGIGGVPHFRIGTEGLFGAQPAPLLLAALRKAVEGLETNPE